MGVLHCQQSSQLDMTVVSRIIMSAWRILGFTVPSGGWRPSGGVQAFVVDLKLRPGGPELPPFLARSNVWRLRYICKKKELRQ